MPADDEPRVNLDEIARLLEAHEGPPEASPRPRAPSRTGLRVTGAVAAGALVVGSALGFGLGSSLAPGGAAASGPAGVGFVPSSGWRVLQSGGDATPLRPALAIASNVRLHPDDDARGIRTSSGLPYATLLGLPPQGVVIVATFTVPGETPDPAFPTLSLPLRLRDATPFGQNSTQIRPARPLGEYELRANINHRDVVVQLYFGRSTPTDAMLTAAQRQLDGLVVQPARSSTQVAQRALPLRPETPASPASPVAPSVAAAKVIDRTLTCTTGFGKGTRNVELLAMSGFRKGGRLERFGQVVVTTPGNPIPSKPQTFAPTLAGLTAGWPPPPPFMSGALGFSTTLCKPTRARVAFSRRGLGGGSASVFGEDVTCVAPQKVVIRVRAIFRSSVTLVPNDKKDYLSADARIDWGRIAVRTANGKALAYGEVRDSGKAWLYTAGSCI